MVSAAVLLLAGMLAEPMQCEALAKLALPRATITSARWMAAGPFTPPVAQGEGAPAPATGAPRTTALMLPAHCQVAMVMTPSSDSHIEAEVWLPAEWNGKFQAVGN